MKFNKMPMRLGVGLGTVALGFGAYLPAAGASPATNTANTHAGSPLAYSFEWDNAVLDDSGPSDRTACISSSGARVCYESSGDYIWVYDSSGDGASAVARWYTDYGRWGTCRNAHGKGHWAYCNKNFAEGAAIYFRASQYDGDTDQYVYGESLLEWSIT
ncbi:hypothetical protein [Actinomadura nitritigenes]|uniref:hypothetical protein n=1 Tax=Actinomadura nitritigenes TaxID=134602 RepID=UPI003D93F11D